MKRQSRRTLIQIVAAVVQNAYIPGFLNGVIYRGKTKLLCVPGLNCYSCPGALGACPIGSLQAALGELRFPTYVLGTLILFGVLLGRLVCGFLCPFGLLQDLLAKIPLPKVKPPRWLDRPLRYLKYVVLILLVALAVLLREPTFCKYLCPAGLLEAGIPLTSLDPQLAGMRGTLFCVKLAVLILIVLLSLSIFRPFCKYLCPLGAFYALFQKTSLIRMRVDTAACIHCGACAKACAMQVDPSVTPNSTECIRCGECVKACPVQALSFLKPKKEKGVIP